MCLDVGLLFQIIAHAEGKPEVERTPFKALFNAYDEVIEEHAVDADPGHVCLHFLFKMGSKDVPGDNLYDKFENLLRHMGIVLEIGDNVNDGTETLEYYRRDLSDGGYSGTVDREPPPGEDTTQPTLQRRASFNSMYDIGDDPTQRSFVNRPSSRSSLSRLETGKPAFPEPKQSPAAGTRDAGPSDRSQLLSKFLDVGRRLFMNELDSSKANQDAPGDETELSIGAQAKSAVHRDRSERMAGASRPRPRESLSSSSSDELDDNDDDNYDDDSIASQGDDNVPYNQQDHPPDNLYRPSLSDLLRDASTFKMYRQRAISRRVLTQWLKRAVQVQQNSQSMQTVAVNRDRFTLLRQAFETWRSIIQGKRQVARTERFFKHLEQRAGRARDLYLMTKAFTHWGQVTSDEVAKTSAARRRVLGVKYFNAWREITAVNELKAQRFAVQRPFKTWRKKLNQIKESEATAAATREQNLTHGVHWQWFWSLCDRRAPRWYDYRLKSRSLLCWLRKFRTNRERLHEIELRNRRLAVESAWQTWAQRSRAIVGAEQKAGSMQHQKLLMDMFGEWKIQACLAPAAFRVSDIVDRRVLQSAFTQWVQRAQMVKQAKVVDKYRIMHNSWTAWNDLLRCQALTARIDERLKMETMYKWILAERFRLMQRIRDQRIKRDVFSTFVASIRETYSRLLHNADIHEDYRSEELLRAKFTCWRDQLVLQRQRELIAFEFYTPRLQQESLLAWRAKHQNVAKMEERAQNARFYFLTNRTMKQWHTATLESAKRRRKEAYSIIRRKVKINMATKAMGSWRSWTGYVVDMEAQAFQFHRRKSLKIASDILDQWYDQASSRVDDCREAESYYARQTAYGQLMRWTEMYFENQDMEEQASGIYRLHVLGQANSSLRKLSLRIFQIRSTFETADSMRERTLKKHARGMFRNWVDKARTKLEERDFAAPLVTPGRGFDGTLGTRSGRTPFDPWYPMETPFKASDFGSVSQGPSASPLATPSYMSSPSKRAARAKALAQGSTTPATPLHTPFAGRLLRAEAMAARTASTRRRNGRGSSLGTSVRFVDEEPKSPSEGRRSGSRRIGS